MTDGDRPDLEQEEAAPAGTIFFSYSRTDREAAVPIIDVLESSGIGVWWDGLLRGGERFAQTTEQALENADSVVVLWSKASISSDWVRDEATRGRDRRCMISLSLDGSEPPLGFRQIQYIDMSGWSGKAEAPEIAELLHAIEACEQEGAPFALGSGRASASNDSKMSRRTVMLGGAGLVAAVAGLGLWQSGVLSGTGGPQGSIAVMPFENLSADDGQGYLARGLTEEIRTALALNPQLDVMAQTSSERFSGQGLDAREISRQLKVGHILEGSIRREGTRLRVTSRLVDGESGFEQWSEVFEREASEVLDVQRSIAAEAVDALLLNLGEGGAITERLGGTDNPEALDAFLRGREFYSQAKDESTDRAAKAAFEQAVALDPQYAAAFAALSRVNTVLASTSGAGKDLDRYGSAALEAARRAIELVPDMAEGHAALGFAMTNARLDIAGAREPYQRSFELGFGNADILVSYSIYARLIGRFDDARAALDRAERLDPLNGSVFRSGALVGFAARDFDQARKSARSALALNSDVSAVNRVLGDIALLEGDGQGALAAYEQEPSGLSRLRGLAMARQVLGDADGAQAALAALVEEYGDNSFYQQAQVFAQWGENDRAIEALRSGAENGDSGMILMATDPMLDPIRQDRRFEALLSQLGFGLGDSEE